MPPTGFTFSTVLMLRLSVAQPNIEAIPASHLVKDEGRPIGRVQNIDDNKAGGGDLVLPGVNEKALRLCCKLLSFILTENVPPLPGPIVFPAVYAASSNDMEAVGCSARTSSNLFSSPSPVSR